MNISLYVLQLKNPRPNDHNISTQHIATLLVATCCVRLGTLLRRVATRWELKIELVRMPWRNIVARTWPNDYNIMQHPRMLGEKFDHFQIWADNTQHVATSRNRVAKRAKHATPSNVAMCCVEVLRSFGWGLSLFNLWATQTCGFYPSSNTFSYFRFFVFSKLPAYIITRWCLLNNNFIFI